MPRLYAILPLLCILAPCWSSPLAAQIDNTLGGIEGFRFSREIHIDQTTTAERVGEFPSPVLMEYGFLSYSRWRVRPAGLELSVYEMTDTQAAFGLFSQWRSEERSQGVSTRPDGETLLTGDSIALWRGHYFLVARGAESQEAELTALSRTLRAAIGERNLHPTSIFQLPPEGLKPDSVRLYLGPISLRENPAVPEYLIRELGFEKQAEVAFAQYGSEDEGLLLAAYPTQRLALEYVARIRDAVESDFGASIYLKLSGPLLGMYLGGQEGATQVLGDLRYSASIEWVHEKAPPLPDLAARRDEVRGLLGAVSGAMILTGVFIVSVLFIGLVLGLIRVVLIRRFPILEVRDDSVYLDLRG